MIALGEKLLNDKEASYSDADYVVEQLTLLNYVATYVVISATKYGCAIPRERIHFFGWLSAEPASAFNRTLRETLDRMTIEPPSPITSYLLNDEELQSLFPFIDQPAKKKHVGVVDLKYNDKHGNIFSLNGVDWPPNWEASLHPSSMLARPT